MNTLPENPAAAANVIVKRGILNEEDCKVHIQDNETSVNLTPSTVKETCTMDDVKTEQIDGDLCPVKLEKNLDVEDDMYNKIVLKEEPSANSIDFNKSALCSNQLEQPKIIDITDTVMKSDYSEIYLPIKLETVDQANCANNVMINDAVFIENDEMKLTFKPESVVGECLKFESEDSVLSQEEMDSENVSDPNRSHQSTPEEEFQEYECYICGYKTDNKSYVEPSRYGGSYLCLFCSYQVNGNMIPYMTPEEAHARKTVEEAIHHCNYCTFKSKSEHLLKGHIEKRHMKSTLIYKCTLCTCTVTKYSSIVEHVKEAHKQTLQKFECPKCKRSFDALKHIYAHFASVHHGDTDEFTCNECNFSSKKPRDFLIHLRDNHESILYRTVKKTVIVKS